MPRQYATFDCGMWDDPDGFSRLSAGAQRTYFMLVTQRDISACGLLPLTLRRWASTCVDKHVDEWIKELEAERYVLVDEDTEEVLVRTFMKWDAGYKHAKRVQAVIASALAIRSLPIRRAALEELASLDVPVDHPKATESLRSVVTEVSTDHTPETRNQGGEPSHSDTPPLNPDYCEDHQPNGTDENCGRCAARRRHREAAARAALDAEVEAKRARAAAIAACPLCNDKGIREHPQSGMPLGRCDHTLEAVSA